jgi:opacity protein-like surface antigen
MTASRSAALVGALFVFGSMAPVSAADLGRGGSLKDDMPVLMQQSAARFYVRADGSYAAYDRPSITIDQQYDLQNPKIDGNWSYGGGVGYYFSKNWRMDLTLEARESADVSGNVFYNGGDLKGKVGLKSTLGLANVYYDFAGHGRFAPYVGAGLGFVNHKVSSGTFTDTCGCSYDVAAGSNTSVAAALMAGVAINLTNRGPEAGSHEGAGGGEIARNLYLDVGYRFLYLGEAETGAITARPSPAATPVVVSPDPTIGEIHAHEIRVGLRYDFR